MANTVNGQTAMNSGNTTYREIVPVQATLFKNVYPPGFVLRARVALDGAGGDFTVDDPTLNNPGFSGSNYPDQTIFIVGIEYTTSAGNTISFKSQIGSGTVKTLSTFVLAANGGEDVPIRTDTVLRPTDAGGKLIVNASAAVNMLIHYVIADEMIPRYY